MAAFKTVRRRVSPLVSVGSLRACFIVMPQGGSAVLICQGARRKGRLLPILQVLVKRLFDASQELVVIERFADLRRGAKVGARQAGNRVFIGGHEYGGKGWLE